MLLRLFWVGTIALLASVAAAGHQVVEVTGDRLEIGEPLPAVRWDGLEPHAAAYLGVAEAAKSTDEIPGQLLLVEFLNTHCQSCKAQAPVMVKLQEMIDSDEELKGKARIVAFAQGNTHQEVESFRAEYGISFPILPDSRFIAYETFGNPGGTPYTVLCVKHSGRWMVATTHLGAITTPMLPFFDMKQFRNIDPSLYKGLAEEESAFQVVRKPPKMSMPEDELLRRIKGLPLLKDKDVKVKAVDLPHAGRAYRIEASGGPYFTRVYSVAPVCDICHALHFAVVFDRYGEVVDFLKIRITWYGNQEISEDDVAFLRGRLKGFSAFRPRMFDPSVDAVSGATMSSALVFNAVSRSGPLFQDLIEAGHVSP